MAFDSIQWVVGLPVKTCWNCLATQAAGIVR
jgi:hypothetical protein